MPQVGLLVAAILLTLSAATGQAGVALDEGRELYREGRYEEAVPRLTTARRLDPRDSGSALWLGLALLKADRPAEAADHWRDYLRLRGESAEANDLRRLLTIVLREAYQQTARDALANEKALSEIPPDARAVAVTPFRNLGSSRFDPLARAFAAMLIDNLSALDAVRVLERDRVQVLLDEAALGASELVDPRSAARAGRLLVRAES